MTRVMEYRFGAGLLPAVEELACDLCSAFTMSTADGHRSWLALCRHSGLDRWLMCLQEGSFGHLSEPCRRPPLVAAIAELVEDATELAEYAHLDRSHLALSTMILTASSIPAGPAAPVVLAAAGFTVPAAALHGITAVLLTAGAVNFLLRFENEPWTRAPTITGALACMTSAALQLAHLGLAVHGCPAWLTQYVVNPDLVLHYLGDLICIPLLEANLCCLSGTSYIEMIPVVALSTLTTCGTIASVTLANPVHQAACIGGSVLGIALTGQVLQPFIDQARTIEHNNHRRCGISRDLLVFTWTLYPITQGLVTMGTLTPDVEVYLLGALDLLNKLGVSHLTLKDPKALQNSYQAAAAQQQD